MQNKDRSKEMKEFIKSNLLIIIGAIAGAAGGYLYWKYAGCSSGQCLITSHPFNSTIYGAVMGGLIFSILKPQKTKSKENKYEEQHSNRNNS